MTAPTTSVRSILNNYAAYSSNHNVDQHIVDLHKRVMTFYQKVAPDIAWSGTLNVGQSLVSGRLSQITSLNHTSSSSTISCLCDDLDPTLYMKLLAYEKLTRFPLIFIKEFILKNPQTKQGSLNQLFNEIVDLDLLTEVELERLERILNRYNEPTLVLDQINNMREALFNVNDATSFVANNSLKQIENLIEELQNDEVAKKLSEELTEVLKDLEAQKQVSKSFKNMAPVFRVLYFIYNTISVVIMTKLTGKIYNKDLTRYMKILHCVGLALLGFFNHLLISEGIFGNLAEGQYQTSDAILTAPSKEFKWKQSIPKDEPQQLPHRYVLKYRAFIIQELLAIRQWQKNLATVR